MTSEPDRLRQIWFLSSKLAFACAVALAPGDANASAVRPEAYVAAIEKYLAELAILVRP